MVGRMQESRWGSCSPREEQMPAAISFTLGSVEGTEKAGTGMLFCSLATLFLVSFVASSSWSVTVSCRRFSGFDSLSCHGSGNQTAGIGCWARSASRRRSMLGNPLALAKSCAWNGKGCEGGVQSGEEKSLEAGAAQTLSVEKSPRLDPALRERPRIWPRMARAMDLCPRPLLPGALRLG